MDKFDRSLAVVIGINDYQNGIDKLKTAVPDAVEIAEILRDTYKYTLINPDCDSVDYHDCESRSNKKNSQAKLVEKVTKKIRIGTI